MATIKGPTNDVYSVQSHPGRHHIVTGGYDKVIRLHDVRTGICVRQFAGHTLSVSRAVFNMLGNLVLSGSKDGTVKLWDLTSGVCVKTFGGCAAEITFVDLSSTDDSLLASARGNTNFLIDLRTMRISRRLRGHQNTCKSFVRSRFGPGDGMVVGGSEDGCVYIWDAKKGGVVQRLVGHDGAVFDAVWNNHVLTSGADDTTIRTWDYAEGAAAAGLPTASGTAAAVAAAVPPPQEKA